MGTGYAIGRDELVEGERSARGQEGLPGAALDARAVERGPEGLDLPLEKGRRIGSSGKTESGRVLRELALDAEHAIAFEPAYDGERLGIVAVSLLELANEATAAVVAE
jgi:hypothetical protein